MSGECVSDACWPVWLICLCLMQDSDLRSALLLEQAAHCFIHMRTPMVRKFAFHMILAGHRYSKAGQVRPFGGAALPW